MQWKKRAALWLVVSQLFMGGAWAAAPALQVKVEREPGFVWRLDAPNTLKLPRNYRVDQPLRASGSGQPSALNLAAVVNDLKARGVEPGQVVDVDLRQESHGYFNGAAVSWYGKNNWGNVGLAPAAVTAAENRQLSQLSGREETYYSLSKKKLPKDPVSVQVLLAPTEEQLAAVFGVGYKRFPCTDHLWPEDQQVDVFLQWADTLPPEAWLHFHCQAGVGRTTAFLAIWDIWRNAPQDSLETITDRQAKLGGLDLLNLKATGWMESANARKIYRVRQFYQYTVEKKAGKTNLSWSEYLKQNP